MSSQVAAGTIIGIMFALWFYPIFRDYREERKRIALLEFQKTVNLARQYDLPYPVDETDSRLLDEDSLH